MIFEDLKNIFNNSQLISFVTEDPEIKSLVGKSVKINKNLNSDCVIIKTVNTSEFNVSYICKVTSGQSGAILDKILSAKTFYFAHVLSFDSKKVDVEIVSVPQIIRFSEPVELGITDGALGGVSVDEFAKKLSDSYSFVNGDKRYFIYAKHIYGKPEMFSLVNGFTLLDVEQKRRADCGRCAEENADDTIFAVTSPEKIYKKGDYSYTALDMQLKIVDFTSAGFAARQNTAFINSSMEKYVSGWETYCQLEFDYVKSKQQEAGKLFYNHRKEKESEVEFDIENYESLGNFKKIRAKISSSKGQSEDLIVTGANSSRVLLKFKEIRDDKLICERTQKNDYDIPAAGEIEINIKGYEVQYLRRIGALDRIISSKSGIPNLAMLLSGTGAMPTTRDVLATGDDEELKRLFGGYMPTQNQRKAIDIALNTPDIAIIQGPPGTGKTKVINAIQHRISKEERDKTLIFGKNVLTAYQQEATQNLARSIRIYGLPVPSILGANKAETEVLEKEFTKWLEEKTREIEQKNAEIYADVLKRHDRNNFCNIFTRYENNVNIYTYENAVAELKALLNDVGDNVTGKFRGEIEALLTEAEEQRKKQVNRIYSYGAVVARDIPTCETSYADGGRETVERILIELEIEEGEGIKELLAELKKCFAVDNVDFERVRKIKNALIVKLQPRNALIIPKAYNLKVVGLLKGINDSMEEADATDEQKIISDYVEAFLYNPFQIRSAIDKFITVISATHQKVVDKNLANKKQAVEDNLLYDNVLVDEAARSCPPDLLIPMSCAKDRIILVGDHKQLPQFINEEIYDLIDEKTMSVSDKLSLKETMFERLIEQVKKLTEADGVPRFITLDTQYRMRKILGDFVSRNFYEQDGVKIESGKNDSCFYHNLPKLKGKDVTNKAMIWLNVKGAEEPLKEGGYRRRSEAEEIAKYVKDILESTEETIGVLSFYNAQVKLIKEKLAELDICEQEGKSLRVKSEYSSRLTVNTVDDFQGLEMDVILLSMTRSNRDGKFGFIDNRDGRMRKLYGKNRLCVALSRQRKCLIIAGDGQMISKPNAVEIIPALCDFYNICKRGGDSVEFID